MAGGPRKLGEKTGLGRLGSFTRCEVSSKIGFEEVGSSKLRVVTVISCGADSFVLETAEV